MTGLSRRQLLAAAAAGSASLALGAGRPYRVRAATAPFIHGVASGDPTADAVILWTRVTPTEAATPGSSAGPPVDVVWEMAADPSFLTVLRTGSFRTGPERDHTVKVDVGGLRADTDHWYRFRLAGAVSPVGRTRTLPAAGTTLASMRLGVVTCAEWEFGFFGAYRDLAERDDVAAVIHLGDYIYEFGRTYGPRDTPGSDFGRVHEPAHETVTLADYRIRYGQYHTDAGLQALHAAHPMVVMYDDHEIANDTWREGAENHDNREGRFAVRATQARQAFREWMPIREDPADPERVYRSLRLGDLAELWMLDERRYRDAPPESGLFSIGSFDPAIEAEGRTMIGLEQRAWFTEGLKRSTARWKLVGNPVPMIPQNVGPEIPDALKAALLPLTAELPINRPAYYIDDWNGYVAERTILFELFDTIDDVVVLTGDYHESFASDLPADLGAYAIDGHSVAVEFVTPSVTSPGYGETLALIPGTELLTNQVNTLFEANFATSNRWIKYHDGFRNGYGVLELRDDAAQFDFVYVADKTRADTPAAVGASWQTVRGSSRVTKARGPLPPRDRDAGGAAPSSTPPVASSAGNGHPESLPATGGLPTGVVMTAAAAAAAGLALRRPQRTSPDSVR